MTKTLAANQSVLKATEGATALDMNVSVEQAKVIEKYDQSNDLPIENISMENANYLQNMEESEKNLNDETFRQEDKIPNFEVDSIELVTPELFSQDEENNYLKSENNEMKMFDDSNIHLDIT